jgi:hypothetical protein
MSQDTGVSVAEGKFELSFNSFMRAVMTPMLCGRRRCRVELRRTRLRVKMGLAGWAFAATIPRSSITGATRVSGPVLAWGAHGWRGRWLINGSSRGLVRISIDPAGRGRCLFFPLRVKELTVSLETPDEFVAALSR